MRLRITVLASACLLVVMAGDGQAEQRTITTTGFAVEVFEPDWARFAIQVRLEGSYNRSLKARTILRADSLASRLRNIAPRECSVAVGPVTRWRDLERFESGERIERKGAQVLAEIRCSGSVQIRSVLDETARWSGCIVHPRECGLFSDSAAIRIVSERAIMDARDQAGTSSALLGVSLADLMTANVNPIMGTEPLSSCGGSPRALFDQFYARGQSAHVQDRFKVIRRAIAVLTYDLK